MLIGDYARLHIANPGTSVIFNGFREERAERD